MSTTLDNARRKLLSRLHAIQPRGDARQVTSAAGNVGGTTAIVNALGQYPDDSFIDVAYLVLPTGPTNSSGSLEYQVISAFDQADGSGNTTVTTSEAFSAQVASGQDCYVSMLNPDDVLDALNYAAAQVFPDIFTPRVYNHITDSRVFNGLFDFWDSATVPTFWSYADSSALTVSKDTSPWLGQYGVKLVASAAGAQFIRFRPPFPSLLNELDGESITLHAMIYATAANKGGVTIADGDGDGATVYHTGDSTWQEVVTAARTITEGDISQQIEWRLNCAASATVRFGPAWTEGGPRQRDILLPDAFKRGPSRIRQRSTDMPSHLRPADPIGGWSLEEFYPATSQAGTLYSDKVLRNEDYFGVSGPKILEMWGEDYLAQCSSESDVYEIDPPRDDAFYCKAAAYLKAQAGQLQNASGSEFAQAMSYDWESRYNSMMKQPGMRMKRQPVTLEPFLGRPGR